MLIKRALLGSSYASKPMLLRRGFDLLAFQRGHFKFLGACIICRKHIFWLKLFTWSSGASDCRLKVGSIVETYRHYSLSTLSDVKTFRKGGACSFLLNFPNEANDACLAPVITASSVQQQSMFAYCLEKMNLKIISAYRHGKNALIEARTTARS